MGGASGLKHGVVLGLFALGAAGCGEAHRCNGCTDEVVAGGSSAGGSATAGSGTGGVATAGSGGQRPTSPPGITVCNVGAIAAPLVRYSRVDLEWTMQEVIGQGGALPFDDSDRSGFGEGRSASLPFVEKLFEVASERVARMSLDEARLAPCEAGVEDRSACVDGLIEQYGAWLYRRPLTAQELEGYLGQLDAHAATLSRADAARQVVLSMLMSPYFVFRIELGQIQPIALAAPAPPNGIPLAPITFPEGTQLSSFEIAARLSHFILRRAPDSALLHAASNDDFRDPAVVEAHARRLLAEASSRPARVLQHLEWLHLDRFDATALGPELSAEMLTQTSTFIDDVLSVRDGSLTELLTSARQPLNATLAEHYGIAASVGDAFELVELDPELYSGVLGQGAWLTRNPRPTYRGRGIFDYLLCTAPPPPPPDIMMEGYEGATPRERISNATAAQPCQSCHSMFDPTGFALEAFDEQGRLTGYDTSGALRLPSALEPIELSGPAALGQALAQSHDARLCAAYRYLEHLLEYRITDQNTDQLLNCLLQPFWSRDLDLNHLALQVAVSSVASRMLRPAVMLDGPAALALDPLEHAHEESEALRLAFKDPADVSAITTYQNALLELMAKLAAQ